GAADRAVEAVAVERPAGAGDVDGSVDAEQRVGLDRPAGEVDRAAARPITGRAGAERDLRYEQRAPAEIERPDVAGRRGRIGRVPKDDVVRLDVAATDVQRGVVGVADGDRVVDIEFAGARDAHGLTAGRTVAADRERH